MKYYIQLFLIPIIKLISCIFVVLHLILCQRRRFQPVVIRIRFTCSTLSSTPARAISSALLLSLSLRLAQGTLANSLVHGAILRHHELVERRRDRGQEPSHDTVAPVRRRAVSVGRGTTAATNLGQHGTNKGPRSGDGSRSAADLGHGGGNQVSLNELHLDVVGSQLVAKSRGPLLQEGLATGVGGQQGGGEETTERTHGQDQTAAALNHARSDELGDAQSTVAVDSDDVGHLLGGSLDKRNGDRVALADVVDENGDIQIRDEGSQGLVVLVRVAREVHRQDLGLDIGILLCNLLRQRDQLRFRSRDKDNVKLGTRQLQRELLSETIRGAGHDGPATGGTERAKLYRES